MGEGLRLQVTEETTVLDLLNQVEDIAKPVIEDTKVKVVAQEEIVDIDKLLQQDVEEVIPTKGR